MAAEEREIPEAGDEATTEKKAIEEQKNISEAGAEDDVLTKVEVVAETMDLSEIRGKFDSLSVLLEQLPLFDMTVIASNAVRVWKHEGKHWTEGWKPHSTQLSAGAAVQISKVQKLSKVSGKGWNEKSEYWMGCVEGNRWIRLINFRGVATVVPNLETFHSRVAFMSEKIMAMENLIFSEKARRGNAENRMKASIDRMQLIDKAKMMTEERLCEFEERFRETEKTTEEKMSLFQKRIDLAQREATEAQVLMRYFEKRMTDSENARKGLENIIQQNEATLSEVESQLRGSEQREMEFQQKLEESERARAELERIMGSLQRKAEEEDEHVEAVEGKKPNSRTRKRNKSMKR